MKWGSRETFKERRDQHQKQLPILKREISLVWPSASEISVKFVVPKKPYIKLLHQIKKYKLKYFHEQNI